MNVALRKVDCSSLQHAACSASKLNPSALGSRRLKKWGTHRIFMTRSPCITGLMSAPDGYQGMLGLTTSGADCAFTGSTC